MTWSLHATLHVDELDALLHGAFYATTQRARWIYVTRVTRVWFDQMSQINRIVTQTDYLLRNLWPVPLMTSGRLMTPSRYGWEDYPTTKGMRYKFQGEVGAGKSVKDGIVILEQDLSRNCPWIVLYKHTWRTEWTAHIITSFITFICLYIHSTNIFYFHFVFLLTNYK